MGRVLTIVTSEKGGFEIFCLFEGELENIVESDKSSREATSKWYT